MKRIIKACVWADSILKGVTYDDDEKRYRVVRNSGIEETAKDNGIVLENNCRFGLTTTKAARLLKGKIDECNKPNICLIELGGNDCDYRWSEVSDMPDGDHYPITSIAEYKKAISEMVDTLREEEIEPVLVSLPPIDSERFLNWVSKGLNKDNIMKWLGDKDKIFYHHESYNLAMLDVASEKKTFVVDLREQFLLDKNYSEYICTDGIHLNEKGQKKVKECFNKYLINLQ